MRSLNSAKLRDSQTAARRILAAGPAIRAAPRRSTTVMPMPSVARTGDRGGIKAFEAEHVDAEMVRRRALAMEGVDAAAGAEIVFCAFRVPFVFRQHVFARGDRQRALGHFRHHAHSCACRASSRRSSVRRYRRRCGIGRRRNGRNRNRRSQGNLLGCVRNRVASGRP